MATLVTGAIGAVVGFFIGGPSGAAWGWSIGAAVGAVVFAPKGPDIQGPRLNDLKTQTSTYGQPIPRVKGAIRTAGNVIWSTDLVETAHTQDSGGKGGGGGGSSTSYTYAANFATALCEGPVCGVLRIWANGKLLSDTKSSDVLINVTGGYWHDQFAGSYSTTGSSPNIRVYLGTEDQMPDSLIEAHIGVGLTPAYRGLCYIVFENFQLENYGNQIPNITAEVVENGDTFSVTEYISVDTYGDAIVYVPDLNEIWQTYYDNGAGAKGITRVNAADGTLVGHISTSQFTSTVMVYSALHKQVYTYHTSGGMYTHDATTTTQVRDNTLWTSINPACNVNPVDGYVYNATGGANAGATDGYIKKLNPADGSVASSTSIGVTPLDYCFDSDGNMWMIRRSDSALTDDDYHIRITKYTDGTGIIADYLWGINAFPGTPSYGMVYDTDRNSLWIPSSNTGIGSDYLCEFSLNPLAAGQVYNTISNTISQGNMLVYDTFRKVVWCCQDSGSGGSVLGINTADGSTYFSADLSDYTAFNDSFNICLDGDYNVWVGDSGNGALVKIIPGGCILTGKPISDIIKEECALVGLSSGDLDTSLITDTVLGYMLTKRSSVRSNLEPLANAFSFDVTESDWVLKFVPRTQSSIRTISESDLACYEADTQIPAIVAGTRGQDLDLPSRIDVNFLRKESDYQIGNQFARRETVNSETSVTLEWPMVLSDSQALYAAQAQMAESWMARQQGEIYVTRKHIDLDPCDVITIPFGGENRTVIIRKKDESRNGLCKIEFQNYDSSVYSGFGAADGGLVTTQSGASITADSFGILLDLPALLDTHNDPGKYWSVCNPIPEFTWKGASLYKSNDSGLSYFLLVGQDLQATIGEATSVLGNGRTDIFDETNTVTVSFLSGTPSSTSREAVFNGANAVAIESGSGWEILQFRTATLVSGTTYTLSGLLRGRRGTEAFTSGHAVGDRVVILTGSGIARVEGSLAEKGQLRKYKHVTSGQAVIDAYETDFTAICRALIPYSPVQLAGGRDGSGNLALSWRRRTRLSGEWVDGSDVPLSELTEAYEVEIWDSTFTTLKRTITGLTSPNTTYSAADQTTDFGGTQSTVYIRIYQLSDSVGRGDKLQGSI